LEDLIARTPEGYNMLIINEKVKDKTPFLVVCLQECERMNSLLEEIVKSLNDLGMGLSGALNMTD
jgi:dynein heavy chain